MDRQTDNCILRALVRKRKYQINHISLQGGVDGRGVNELEPNRQPPRVNYLSNIQWQCIYTLISSQISYVFLVIAEALL